MDETLRRMLSDADASFMDFGPPIELDDGSARRIELIESMGLYEAEYAAFRKGAAWMPAPHRAMVRVDGPQRLEFVHRFVTQSMTDLPEGAARRGFLLNRQGRILADLFAIHVDDVLWLDTDVFQAGLLSGELEKMRFDEEVTITDASVPYGCLLVAGPAAAKLLRSLAQSEGGEAIAGLGPGEACRFESVVGPAMVERRDQLDVAEYRLWVEADAVTPAAEKLAEALGGLTPEVSGGVRREITGRVVGWLAYNTVRVEAGAPLYHIDFGPDSLPHETSLLDEAVSFTKGCYVGQEVVARMQSLGHPARVLRRLRFDDDKLPTAGAQVFRASDAGGEVIGAVTSSSLAPMAGGVAAALAVMKWGFHNPGTPVAVAAEGAITEAVVAELQG